VSLELPHGRGTLDAVAEGVRAFTEEVLMHKIEVVVESDSFPMVHESLRKSRVGPFRASEIRIFDPTAPPKGCYRGLQYPIGRDCLKLEWIVRDHQVETTVDAVRRGLDELGEGNAEVVVQSVEETAQLRPSIWTRKRATG
jgi:nitrogen regulatory protein PII